MCLDRQTIKRRAISGGWHPPTTGVMLFLIVGHISPTQSADHIMEFLNNLFGPPSQQKFARQFLGELRRCGCNDEFEFDEENFCLRASGDEEHPHIINLINFYHEHCQIPRSERSNHLRRSASACIISQLELPDEFEHARHDLRLKLWCRTAIEKMKLRQLVDGHEKDVDFVLDYVGDHLYVSVVFDFPNSVRTVSREDIERWGVSIYEAMETARQNLLEDDFAFAGINGCLYSAITGDSYDSSRILLLDLIRKLSVEGDPIAMVPNRDSLLITGSRDEEGLEMMLSLAEQAIEDPRPMLFMPLRLDGENWVDWMPPSTHPLYDRFRLLETKYLYPEYEEQKRLLDQLHEQNLTDVFVASFSAVQNTDDSIFSYCVWSEGVDTLLPKTQKVMFFKDGKDIVACGEWDDVVEIVGHLMEETDLYPTRYRVRSFPNEEQLARIGNNKE